MFEVLGPYAENNQDIFQCPSDSGPVKPDDEDHWLWDVFDSSQSDDRSQGRSFFEVEGQSFEYKGSSFGRKIEGKRRRELQKDNWKLSDILLMHDYDPFHGPRDIIGSRHALFADAHVEAF